MLEQLCKGALWDACYKVADTYPLVTLKGYPRKVSPFESFLGHGYVYEWNAIPLAKLSRQKPGSTSRMAWMWFDQNSEAICNAYFEKRFEGNVERAMIYCGTFENLFSDFKAYFEERKNALMEKTEKALQTRKAELASKGKMPQSHGGVANLLKVLTKTMQGQGSSIQTIAKVQYAVCMQAGIFIPDEFLIDVQTAVDIMED